MPTKQEPTFHDRPHGVLTPQLFGWLNASNDASRRTMEQFFKQRWTLEDPFQIQLIDTLYAVMADDFEAAHIPGGSIRAGKRRGAMLRRSGTKAGIYDLMCIWTGRIAFMEAKATQSPSRAQREFGAYLTQTKHPHVVVRSIAAALNALRVWGAPIDPRFLPLTNLEQARLP